MKTLIPALLAVALFALPMIETAQAYLTALSALAQ